MAEFLANENVPQGAVAAARSAGIVMHWMAEIAPGTKDPDVLSYALQHQQVLVTFDKDFGELAFLPL